MATLRLACIDSAALPLFDVSKDGVTRDGYEPELAGLVAEVLGLDLEWAFTAWDNMIPMVRSGEADAVWCGQGIIPERQALVDFTQPYAIFNETVLVRAGDPADGPESMSGYRVGAIANSANMKVAKAIPGAEIVEFGATADVFADMIAALRNGDVDAFVDDDVLTPNAASRAGHNDASQRSHWPKKSAVASASPRGNTATAPAPARLSSSSAGIAW